MTKTKKRERGDVCCNSFYEAYAADEISYAYEKHEEIDETEWFISGLWHLHYCPFCGALIEGRGFGAHEKKDSNPP
ncbi:MAG: hypothetical protein PHI97_28040 [Desulfobulbus sp.]|nr:hypothetical protein [Desulfobulbus sp.]